MKTFLLYKDRDLDREAQLPRNEAALTQDLELGALFDAMAGGDPFLRDIARRVVLAVETDPDTILYRQAVLRDCRKNPAIVRGIYDLATESLEKRKRTFWSFAGRTPGSVLYNAINLLELSVGFLKELRRIADQHAAVFQPKALRRSSRP